MKTKNNNNRNRNTLKTLGSVLTASLIMFGAASCTQDSRVAETEPGAVETTSTVYPQNEQVANRDVTTFNDWDTNADRRVDRNEFNTRMANDTEMYRNWQNEQGQVDQTAFTEGVFVRWDANQDGYLDTNEYAAGNTNWETQFGNNFSTWDRNRDNRLDTNEFNTGINETGIYNDWDRDRDGTISETEFNEGTFNTWDTNRDGYLDDTEYYNAEYDTWSGTHLNNNTGTGINNQY